MTSIGSGTTHTVKRKVAAPKSTTTKIGLGGKAKKPVKGAKRGGAPPLKPNTLAHPTKIEALLALDEDARQETVLGLMRRALGDDTIVDKSTPRAASTTQDRSMAAADLAIATKELGIIFVLKQCEVLNTLQRTLFPDGLQALFNATTVVKGGLRPSTSSLSLASMDSTDATSLGSFGTDSKRGKTNPPNAREGSLLIIRSLCQFIGKPVEPYVLTGFLAAALDECGSASSSVREAAEDTATALIDLASPWAFPRLICPMLTQSLLSTEWRVKYNALERLAQCAKTTSPGQVNYLLPKLIPDITSQVFDTKAQVTKAAASTLLAICQTCKNPDVLPAIPSVVHAICKPADTYKAVDELMATTFVAPVDAPTLSILCPVLARALKEKLAIRKRAACLVIQNMSRLVECPEAVAPFGPLLVPELQKVATNVQFEEIRDAALSALQNLTKALGDAYDADTANAAEQMKRKVEAENARVAAEQERIDAERRAEAAKDVARQKVEEEERKKFKEAMDAQRALDKIAEDEAAKKKQQDAKERDQQRRSTKAKDGKCQACGLKKCKKTCTFFGQ